MNKELFKITDSPKLKTSDILAECRTLFPVYYYWSNEELDKNFPPPKKKTTRYFEKNVEADEEYKNMSADDLGDTGIERGITLRERLLMELQYFKEIGKHLDIKNITLCSGSRFEGGHVPSVHWPLGGRLDVYWYGPDFRREHLRSRQAVLPSNLETQDSNLKSRIKELENFRSKVEKVLKL